MIVRTDAEKPTNPARFSPLIARLFSAGVGTGELRVPADACLLYPEERRFARRFRKRRLADFIAGCLSARRALNGVGFAHFPLTLDPDGGARWPDSVVGSITSTSGFCAAVTTSRNRFDAIGIDAEIVGNMSVEAWPNVFTPAEIASLNRDSAKAQMRLATIMYSAKDAYFACQTVSGAASLGFHDVEISTFENAPKTGSIVVTPARRHLAARRTEGRFLIDGNLVLTGMGFAAGSARRQKT